MGKLHASPIIDRFDQGERDVIGLRLHDGTTLRVTPDHKILTEAGWREAGDLLPGDRVARCHVGPFGDTEAASTTYPCLLGEVLDEEVHYARIAEITPPERAEVFDIEVDEHHTFVADGVVIANCAAPFRQAEFDIMYGKGISREGSLLDVGVDLGIVKKSGAWFTYEGEQLGQGRENAKQFLTENVDLMFDIMDKIKVAAGITDATDGEVAAADAFGPEDDEEITLDS